MGDESRRKAQGSSTPRYCFSISILTSLLTWGFSNVMVQTSRDPMSIDESPGRASDDPVNVRMQLAQGATQGAEQAVATAGPPLDGTAVQSLLLETWMEACTTTAAVKEVFETIAHMKDGVDNGVTFTIW
jgi:hypothetical protein